MGKFTKRISRKAKRKLHQAMEENPEVRDLLDRQLERFREEFGREPGPDDPVFWKTVDGQPVPIGPEDLEPARQFMAARMVEIGRPEFAHAFLKTGMIVTEANVHLLDDEDMAEWEAAVAEYRAQKPS